MEVRMIFIDSPSIILTLNETFMSCTAKNWWSESSHTRLPSIDNGDSLNNGHIIIRVESTAVQSR